MNSGAHNQYITPTKEVMESSTYSYEILMLDESMLIWADEVDGLFFKGLWYFAIVLKEM